MALYHKNMSTTRAIKRTHKKARIVGFLYFLGNLIVGILSLLGCLNLQYANGDGKKELFSILNFTKPFLWIFKGDYSGFMAFLMFLILLIIVIINIGRSFPKLRRVMKKNERNVNACNRNVTAMEDLADIFSASFSAVLVLYTLMYAFTKETGKLYISREGMPLSIIGIIAVAFGLIIHFVAGAIGATSSIFIVSSSIEEKKRESKVFPFVIRSFVKVATSIAFLWLFLRASTIHNSLGDIFGLKFDALMPNGDPMPLVGLLLQIIALIMICVCVKNATSPLEFNLFGMEAYGMRRFAVCALIGGIVSLLVFVLDMGNLKEKPMLISYLIIGVVAIISFVLEFVIKPREEGDKRLDEEHVKKSSKAAAQTPAQAPVQTPVETQFNFPTSIDLRLVPPEMPEQTMMMRGPAKWEILCPHCHKPLKVKEAPYHRCPVCGKVFALNIGKVIDKTVLQEPVEEPKNKKNKKNKKFDWSKISKFNLKREEKKAAKKAKKLAKKNETVYMDADLLAQL